MIKQHPKLIIIAAIIVIALISGLLKYQTSYDQVNISAILKEAEKDLGKNQEIIILQSKNSFSFYDLLFRYKQSMNQDVYGILTFPDNAESYNKSPAIVGVAGSKGWTCNEGYIKYRNECFKEGELPQDVIELKPGILIID